MPRAAYRAFLVSPLRPSGLARVVGVLFFLLAIAGGGACGRMRRLKERLQEPPQPTSRAAAIKPAPKDDTPHATLEVNVSPAEGIALTLDGQKVATRSPFRAGGLAPGTHTLEVRAMGHYSVTLPLTLEAGETLRMPVSLRPRPPRPFGEREAPRTPPPGPSPAALAEPAQTAPVGPRALPLPVDMVPATIKVATRPEQPIWVDDAAAASQEVLLGQRAGILRVGRISLAYVQLVGHATDFIIPADEAAWFVGGRQVKASSHIRLERLPVYLTRQIGGYEQRITLQQKL